MNRKRMFYIMMIAVVLSLFIIPSTFSVFKSSTNGNSTIALATWNVTLEQSGISNDVIIIPGVKTDNYTLNVKSLSEVDIEYNVIISGLPTGVSVLIDGDSPDSTSNNTATFTNVGTILYSANNKINTHTLTFSADNNATYVNNQSITINVIAKQIMSSL